MCHVNIKQLYPCYPVGHNGSIQFVRRNVQLIHSFVSVCLYEESDAIYIVVTFPECFHQFIAVMICWIKSHLGHIPKFPTKSTLVQMLMFISCCNIAPNTSKFMSTPTTICQISLQMVIISNAGGLQRTCFRIAIAVICVCLIETQCPSARTGTVGLGHLARLGSIYDSMCKARENPSNSYCSHIWANSTTSQTLTLAASCSLLHSQIQRYLVHSNASLIPLWIWQL